MSNSTTAMPTTPIPNDAVSYCAYSNVYSGTIYFWKGLFSVTSKSTAQAVGVFLTDNRRGIERISIGTPRRCSFAFTVLITEHVGSYWVPYIQGIYGIYLHMVPGRYSESTWYIQHIQYGVGTA